MTTPTPEHEDRPERGDAALPLEASEVLDLGTQQSELAGSAPAGRRGRRLAPWLTAACALALAGSALVATGHSPWSTSAGSGSSAGLSLRLGTSVSGSRLSSAMSDSATAAKTGAVPSSAIYPVPGWYLTGDLVVDGTLPAGGQQVNLKTLLAEKATLARVSELAAALKLTGEPQRTSDFGGGFKVSSGESQLIVLDVAGHPWAYGRATQNCPVIPPGVLDGVACAVADSGGSAVGAPSAVSGTVSGGGTIGIASSVGTAASPGVDTPPPSDKPSDVPGRNPSTSPSDLPLPIGDPGSVTKPDLPMVDVAAARAAAANVLTLAGMDPAKADVIAGPFASVSASPVIDGTPTQGVETWFSVTSTGIQSASGWLDISSSTVGDGASVTLRSGAEVVNDMRGEPRPAMGIACGTRPGNFGSSPASGAEPSLMPCPTPVPTVITGATSVWLLGYDKDSPVLVPGWSFTVRPTNGMSIGPLVRPAVDPKLFASPQPTDQTNPGATSPGNVGPASPPDPIPNSGPPIEPATSQAVSPEATVGGGGSQPNAVLPAPTSS